MLNNLKSNTPHKARKRVGRGIGSGTGKTSGRGHKGQNARSGGGVRPGFEGGQLPLFQSLPKRGFTNINKVYFQVVNVDRLNVFKDGDLVDAKSLKKQGLVKTEKDLIKILGNGKLERKLTIKANKFSKGALEAIKKSGSTSEVI